MMVLDFTMFYIGFVLPLYLSTGCVLNRSYNDHTLNLTGLERYGFYNGWNWFLFFIVPIFLLMALALLLYFTFLIFIWVYETKWTWMEILSRNLENEQSKKIKLILRVAAGFGYLCFGFLINLLYLTYFQTNSVPANAHSFQRYSGLYTWDNLIILTVAPLLFFLSLYLLYWIYASLKAMITSKMNAMVQKENERRISRGIREVTEKEILARHDQRKMALFEVISKKQDPHSFNHYQLKVCEVQQRFESYTDLCSTLARQSLAAGQNVYLYLTHTLGPAADKETLQATSMVVKILGGGRRPVSLKELESFVHSTDLQKSVMEFLDTFNESEVLSDENKA